MPAHYVIDVEGRLVVTTFSGALTLEEVIAHVAKLRSDPAFKSDFFELIDLCQATEVRLGYSDFQHLATLDPFLFSSKRAFLVPNEGAVLGVTRMFQTIRENPRIQIFHTAGEALAWLQKPD